MKTVFRKRWYVMIPFALVAATGFGLVTMLLWNALLPELFHFPIISFWQAVGLLILTRLLFGTLAGHHGVHGYQMRRNLREKWEQMTPFTDFRFRALY